MSAALIARSMARSPVTATQGGSEALARWRTAPKRAAEEYFPSAELPESLKRGRVDREAHVGAEVVRRERPIDVAISIHVVAALKPDARARWLAFALENAARGVARPSDIYDIVVHPRFAANVSGGLARKMMNDILEQISIFPDRLQLTLGGGDFPLGKVSCRAKAVDERTSSSVATAVGGETSQPPSKSMDKMMARCVEFVRQNEVSLKEAHELDARSFHVRLQRVGTQQTWGLAWSRSAFNAKRRVLEGIVPGSPADQWNKEQLTAGGRPMKAGDELVAVNGDRGWEAMARIKDLLDASLTLVREPEKAAEPSKFGPPPFEQGGYKAGASDGEWLPHEGGKWLYSKADKVYFHVPSKRIYMEDPSDPGTFILLPGDPAAVASGLGDVGPGVMPSSQTAPVNALAGAAAAGIEIVNDESIPTLQLRGRVRWFNRSKGFGFIQPWFEYPAPPCSSSSSSSSRVAAEVHETATTPELVCGLEDVFFHRNALITDTACEAGASLILPVGTPVRFELGLQDDGKLCATNMQTEADLGNLISVGGSAGPSGRLVEKAVVDLRDAEGRCSAGAFAGVVTGSRGVEGAEYVALNMSKHLAACFRGRESGGERVARLAVAAALRQTQQGFLDYARRLSENSASLWLAAETVACVALVFGPEVDGRPRLLFATVGGGRALVVRRDGSVAATLKSSEAAGSAPSQGDVGGVAAAVATAMSLRGNDNPSIVGGGTGAGAASAAREKDPLKAFERGLKGPAIQFPSYRHYVDGGARKARGFGAHAWSEKDGGAAGLQFELHAQALDWHEDALVIIASDAFWDALRELPERSVARAALAGLQEAPAEVDAPTLAAERVLDLVNPASRKDAAVSVLRLGWCEGPLPEAVAISDRAGKRGAKDPTLAHPASVVAAALDGDDMFAAPPMELASPDRFSEDEEQASEESLAANGDRIGPEAQNAAAATSTTVGPKDELDDMFADFCKEVGGV